MRRCCYILFLLVLLSACGDNREVVALLDHAEVVMEEHPDSAYQFLCEADSCVADQSRKTRMRHQMLMTEAKNKLDMPLPSNTLFQEVVDYYDDHGTPNQQLIAHYLLGCIYRDRGEAPMALQCYNDAVEKADTLSDDCDYTTLYKVYGQMADVFEAQVMPNEEIEALKQYSKYALKAGNTYEHIHGIEFMTTAYDLQRDTAMMLSTEQKVHDLYEKYGYKQDAITAYARTIYIYMDRGNYEKAHQLMQDIEIKSGLFDNEGDISAGREHYYNIRGLYYLGIGQLDSAENEFKRLIPYGYTFDAYKGLMKVYKKKKDITRALSCMEQREASFDTLITNIHADATRQAVSMSDYTRHQRIASEERMKSEMTRWIWGTITLALLLIASFIIYHVIQHKKRMAIEHQKEMDLMDLKVQHQNEIIHQKAHANIILQKLLIEKLEHARQLLSDDNAKQMTDEAWKEIEQLINATDNDFVQRLRHQHPDFKETDLQLCMLVRLKVTNATIAQIYHVGESAIKKRKSTLKKTGFQIDDPNITIEQIIENL